MGGGNVGVAMASAAGRMKISLHESGRWQYGYTSEYERTERAAGRWTAGSRHWRRWQRPPEVTPGHTMALKMVVPDIALRPRPEPTKPVHWVDLRVGRSVVFTVWLSRPGDEPWAGAKDLTDSELIARMSLTTGEDVVIGAHHVDTGLARHAMLRSVAGFLDVLMNRDTRPLAPIRTDSDLIGFSEEPTGAQTMTETTLAGIRTGEVLPPASAREVVGGLTEFDDQFAKGNINLELRPPKGFFESRGIDPTLDGLAAEEAVREWSEEKQAEVARLLGLGV